MRRKKIVKKGFRLCMMVCGHSGAGKSTFVNTLCDGKVYPDDNDSKIPTTMEITSKSVGMCSKLPNYRLISLTLHERFV